MRNHIHQQANYCLIADISAATDSMWAILRLLMRKKTKRLLEKPDDICLILLQTCTFRGISRSIFA